MLIERFVTTNNILTDLGGGVNAGPAMTIRDTTIVANSAGSVGGGISNDANLTMTSCTVTGNTAATGGGIAFGDISGNIGGTTVVTNSVVAGNSSSNGADIHSNFTVNTSFCLISNVNGFTEANGSGDLTAGTDPKLGSLQSNGGPSATVALLPGSPLINRGSNAVVPAGMTTDQRGGT